MYEEKKWGREIRVRVEKRREVLCIFLMYDCVFCWFACVCMRVCGRHYK